MERWIKERDEEETVIDRLAFAKDGHTIVGACLCEESVEYNNQNNVKTGRVCSLGVIKKYRRKGIGKALLSEGMKWIHDQGMDTIYIEVDAENPDALHLYTSLGFKIYSEDIIYIKELE